MASLWKRSSSQFWFACFTDHKGKQRKKSTKETDKKKALKMAELLEAEYKKARTAGQMQKLLLEVHRDITGETFHQVSLVDYQVSWLKSKKAEGCAESSQVFYKHSTGKFIAWLGEQAAKPIGAITTGQVKEFRNHLTETLATKTVNHQIKGLRMLFKSAIQDGLITTNPAQSVGTIKATPAGKGGAQKKPAFTLDQIRQILPHCTGEWKTLVLMGLYTGQRLADLQHLRWSQISSDGGMISLVTRKTGRSMTIPTAFALKAHILTLERPKDDSTLVHAKLAQLRTNTLSGIFGDILIAAKLRDKDAKPMERGQSRLSFHSLRHSAVTLLKEAGVPLATVMALIGHDSEAMSENYTKIGPESMAAGAAAFPTI